LCNRQPAGEPFIREPLQGKPLSESEATPHILGNQPINSASARWIDLSERGTRLGVRIVLAFGALLGRAGARLTLPFIVFYYLLFDSNARRSSANYLRVVTGRRAKLGMVFRHILTFAQVALDRVYFLRGRYDAFEIVSHGGFKYLQALKASGRGGILLSAHLGSAEAMRARADARDLAVHAVVYQSNSPLINSVMNGIGSAISERVIEIDPRSPTSILKLKQRIDEGHIVAIQGDRTDLSHRVAVVNFFDRPARFPTGPYLLAALLRCPIYFAVGLYSSPNRYDFYCEPLIENLTLPRVGRDEALAKYAQHYAGRLEFYCRLAPLNWFNFYDFWRLDE
jgi:predicted LPLAT superfamily acyltransferase